MVSFLKHSKLQKSRGIVLVVVLWTIVLITFMISAMNFQSNNSIVQAQMARERLEAKSLAQAAVYYTNTRFRLNSADYPVSLNDSPLLLSQWGVPIEVSLRALSGAINPNLASFDLLYALISGVMNDLGIEGNAYAIAEGIVNWRENNGGVRHRFFALEELRLIEGLSETIFIAMLPHLSIYAPTDKVNPESASLELLTLLFPEQNNEVIQYVQEREQAVAERARLPDFPFVSNILMVQQNNFAYLAEVQIALPSGGKYRVSTVVFQGKDGEILLKDWKDELGE